MKCKDIKKTYYKYIDCKASQAEYESVQEHLENCPECKKEIESIEKMRGLIQKSGEFQVSDNYWKTYWERLEKKLPEEPEKVTIMNRIYDVLSRFSRRPVLIGKIVAVALVLALALYMVPDSPLHRHKITQEESRLSTESDDEINLFYSMPEREEMLGENPDSIVNYDSDNAEGIQPALPTDELNLELKKNSVREMAEAKSELHTKVGDAPAIKTQIIDTEVVSNEIYNAAEAHFANGEFESAIESYNRFLEINKYDENSELNLKARYQIGESYYQIGNYPEALSNFIVVANVDNPEIKELKRSDIGRRARSAKIAYDKEISKEADTKQKTKAAPVKPDAVRFAIRENRDEESKSKRDKLIANAIYRQAQAYEKLKKQDKALNAYRDYLEKFPEGEFASKAKEAISKIQD
ncbi:tetratricopeptide repeat protein [Candidatus Poribacteria bacterium]|nr:tetratricopeptide repeat protein [Candidatus Poribacteria bacterium]